MTFTVRPQHPATAEVLPALVAPSGTTDSVPPSAGVTGSAPGAATLVSPSGSPRRTTYTWNVAHTATDYYLWVKDASGTPVVHVWVPAASACASGTCTHTPPGTLAAGAHTWWIQARNVAGLGPWSAGRTFNAQ